MMSPSTSSSAAPAAAGAERRRPHVSVACGGLPRPTRPAGPRPGTPRPGAPGGAGAAQPRRPVPECNWWGAGARQAAAAAAPRRPRSGRGARPLARVPTGKGNRELVRRALAPPPARGAVLMRKWSFRPAPSRLRNASSLSSTSPVSPRPRAS